MALLRRTRDPEPAPAAGPHPITAFWTWWSGPGREIDPSCESPATDELTRFVTAIHPGLTWRFGRGTQAQHRLTVTAGGVAAVRPAAERWLRAAPPADRVWEYRSSQQADPDSLTTVLRIDDAELDLRALQFRLEPDDDALRVHIGVHHPSFAALPERTRSQITFLVLDWLVGEDDVERWLGTVEPLTTPPSASAGAGEVAEAVARLAATRDPDSWVLARGTDRGRPMLATWRRGVRWVDAAHYDRHQQVTATYRARPDGMPADASVLPRMRVIEDELEMVLGSGGLLVAITTCAGARTFHAYTDGEDQNVDEALAAWAGPRRLTVQAEHDPAWHAVREFTG